MKRRNLIALVIAVLFGLFAFVPQTAFAAAKDRNVPYIASTETNGIASRIDAYRPSTTSGGGWNPGGGWPGGGWNPGGGSGGQTTYENAYKIFLPGCAVASECYLSWDYEMQIIVNGVTYNSGECPIPPVGSEMTYTLVTAEGSVNYQVSTYQGSPAVQAVYIEIDETGGKPTIEQMNNDGDHETECSGYINIAGTWYEMPKMKGRGNVTWNQNSGKKPYNITLDKKINWPGVDSDKTKKWSILSEPYDESLLGNRTGFYMAHEMGVGQDTVSADVWMNGEYLGCYTVTPKTDSFVTKNGYMLEDDNYTEDAIEQGGDPQFVLKGSGTSGTSGNGPRITVKKIGDNLLESYGYEDPESAASLRAATADIQTWMQDAWDAIRSTTGYNSKGKYYTEYIDIESFAKMYLMHEYVKSFDVCAGSILFYREGTGEGDLLYAGPIWDLDNAMGSTQQNGGLGAADNRSTGDRRSGEGYFISNIGNRVSIYKSLGTHNDFMVEVFRQLNIYRDTFASLPYVVDQMAADIEASALMNHIKVKKVGNSDHIFNSTTTLGSGQYRQTYVATNGNTTIWANHVKNLRTYVATRSLWFYNNYNITYYGNESDGWATLDTAKTITVYFKDGEPMAEGWAEYEGAWYYLKYFKVIKEGWAAYEDTWCYIKNYVPMKEGWVKYGNYYVYFQDYTLLEEGWVNYSGSWYYIQDYIPVVNDWVEYEGTWYHFNKNGVCDRTYVAA